MKLPPAISHSLAVALVLTSSARNAPAQTINADSAAVIAVADSVLAALSRNDGATLARLTMDSAVVGAAGVRGGVERVSLRTFALYVNYTGASFTERGFDAWARVQDRVALVWMPYDLYRGAEWSHCGVDVFTMMKSDGRWRVAAVVYTVEQPPACRRHPSGPPAR